MARALRMPRQKENMDMLNVTKSQTNGTSARVPALSAELEAFAPNLRDL